MRDAGPVALKAGPGDYNLPSKLVARWEEARSRSAVLGQGKPLALFVASSLASHHGWPLPPPPRQVRRTDPPPQQQAEPSGQAPPRAAPAPRDFASPLQAALFAQLDSYRDVHFSSRTLPAVPDPGAAQGDPRDAAREARRAPDDVADACLLHLLVRVWEFFPGSPDAARPSLACGFGRKDAPSGVQRTARQSQPSPGGADVPPRPAPAGPRAAHADARPAQHRAPAEARGRRGQPPRAR